MSEHVFRVQGQADEHPYWLDEAGEPMVQIGDLVRALHLHGDRMVNLDEVAPALGFGTFRATERTIELVPCGRE